MPLFKYVLYYKRIYICLWIYVPKCVIRTYEFSFLWICNSKHRKEISKKFLPLFHLLYFHLNIKRKTTQRKKEKKWRKNVTWMLKKINIFPLIQFVPIYFRNQSINVIKYCYIWRSFLRKTRQNFSLLLSTKLLLFRFEYFRFCLTS